MRWPPSKAWTSTKPFKGYRHFVAINYGGRGEERWVNLISVLDGEVGFKVPWIDLKNTSVWVSGWQQLTASEDQSLDASIKLEGTQQNTCRHSSLDSGLHLPIGDNSVRPWFDE